MINFTLWSDSGHFFAGKVGCTLLSRASDRGNRLAAPTHWAFAHRFYEKSRWQWRRVTGEKDRGDQHLVAIRIAWESPFDISSRQRGILQHPSSCPLTLGKDHYPQKDHQLRQDHYLVKRPWRVMSWKSGKRWDRYLIIMNQSVRNDRSSFPTKRSKVAIDLRSHSSLFQHWNRDGLFHSATTHCNSGI